MNNNLKFQIWIYYNIMLSHCLKCNADTESNIQRASKACNGRTMLLS